MTDQIDAAVAEAEAAAANMTEQRALTPAQTAGALAQPAAPVDMSLSGFLKAGSIQPDIWIQVKDTGMKLNKEEKATIDEFDATLDFGSVKLFTGLRIKLPGNKYEYIKTYDGRTEAKSGENWNTAVANAQARAQEAATTYRGADMILVLTKDVKQGAKTIEAGKKLGYTTSITGFAPFQSLLNEVINDNSVQVGANDSLSGQISVKVNHEAKKNNDYEWGILNFTKTA